MAGNNGKILVVDDDRTVLTGLRHVLESQDYQVLIADNVTDGLDAAARHTPDLIILDMKMPRRSGVSFLNEISLPGNKLKYPVIVLTAYANMQGFFDNIDVDGFLLKPCTADQLLTEVARIIGSKQTTDTKAVRDKDGRKGGETETKTVLIADNDEFAKTRLVQEFLSEHFKVEWADNGSDAIAKAIMLCPDLFVVRGLLPKMNGYTLVSMLREIPKVSSMPVIIYDASHISESHCRALAADGRGPFRLVSTEHPKMVVKIANQFIRQITGPVSPDPG